MNHCINTLLTIFVACLLVAAMAGCGSKPTYAFDELDSTPAQDELIEFPLGTYSIPIPLVNRSTSTAPRSETASSFLSHCMPWSPAMAKRNWPACGNGTKASSAIG